MASTCMVISRQISTSSICRGKRNFRMIQLYNKRGSRAYKLERSKNPNYDIPIDTRGVKPTGKWVDNHWVEIPEMIPELIVPSLKDFHLKPYVSYRVTDVGQREYTAKDLFDLVYADKITRDYKQGQLGPNGEPLNPTKYEKMTAKEARAAADKTGTDIFEVTENELQAESHILEKK
ncbi:mitochondrial ribosomal protein L41 [Xylocopa sonorina]|uniref:mitochondrial ribosomal protein L41 n=1 Tax=Xylocopa sonorina TaxID=1818115 RepID=UPI00403B1147